MRIISGKSKGKKIFDPIDINTRPLKDLTKESIFNIITHSNKFNTALEKSNILDLFSGVGSFGLECLSRGSNSVTFVENYSIVLPILKKNIFNLGYQDNSSVINKNILNQLNFKNFDTKFDIIFIDTGAGISANVVDFVFLAEEVIVIMTPEPTAFADAYAMVKLLHIEKPIMNVGVIVNIVQNEDEGEKIFTKFNEIVKRFLGKEISYRGTIARDKIVVQSIMRQIPLAMYADKSLAMQSFRKISENLLGIKKTNKKSLFSR